MSVHRRLSLRAGLPVGEFYNPMARHTHGIGLTPSTIFSMRMSPTHAFGGGIADPNMQVTEIQNTPVPPRPLLDVYGPPLPQLQPRPPAPRPLDAYRYPAPSASQSCLPRTQPLQSPLPLPSQRQCRQRQQQRTRHQASPPLVHRHGKRTVYVQDAVFKLLVMSQLDTSN